MNTEARLWKSWDETKSDNAVEDLINHYLPLVTYHVQRVSNGLPVSVTKDELKSHALEGLLDAIHKFDSSRALKFDTYASFRIRGAMIDGLRREDPLPRTIREKIKKMDQVTEKLEQERGRSVDFFEVAQLMDLSEKEISLLKYEQLMSTNLSFDDMINGSKDQSYASQIQDPMTRNPEDKLVAEDTRKELAERILCLSENEQLVIQLSYYEELTLTEIGRVLSLSTSRISQIHARAIDKLKQGLVKKEFVR
ncbi:RNA polymerase sigma factor for flagellar operon [Bacillus sp. JCM 19045]|nr:RNA polymerase sigma factor for flagellar operon [Bacillus sp. JCM 19045]